MKVINFVIAHWFPESGSPFETYVHILIFGVANANIPKVQRIHKRNRIYVCVEYLRTDSTIWSKTIPQRWSTLHLCLNKLNLENTNKPERGRERERGREKKTTVVGLTSVPLAKSHVKRIRETILSENNKN